MLGGFTGLLPIGWIVLNIIFLHQLADKNGAFKIQEDSIANITAGPAPAAAADRLLASAPSSKARPASARRWR